MRPPGAAGWCGQASVATMAARKRRDLADLLARQTDRHGTAFQIWCGERVKLSYKP